VLEKILTCSLVVKTRVPRPRPRLRPPKTVSVKNNTAEIGINM